MTAHEELLYWASVNNHPLYDRYLQESYEKEHGPHFDEEYAKKAVADMCSRAQLQEAQPRELCPDRRCHDLGVLRSRCP